MEPRELWAKVDNVHQSLADNVKELEVLKNGTSDRELDRRALALAITKLEEAQMWLQRAEVGR